jgi:excisionase family DNA binding protein
VPRTRVLPDPPALPKPKITADESAQRLGVSKRTIWNLVARGNLTCYRLGTTRITRFDPAEVDALLKPSR